MNCHPTYCHVLMNRRPSAAQALSLAPFGITSFWSFFPRFMGLLLSILASLSTPARAAETTPASLADAVEYRLGAGDLVRILVYQSPDLSFDTRLSDRGIISYPLLGNLQLGGRTLREAESLIAKGLKTNEVIKEPQVILFLMEVRGNQVNVLGQVGRPGRYPLEAGVTRLSDILATAGGVTPGVGGDVITVVGTRKGQSFGWTIDLPKVFDFNSPDRLGDLVLQANDVIYVERAPMFYIYGEVQKPGQVRLERGMTLLQGLAAGGGLTQRGSDKGIRVHRSGTGGKTEILQPGMDEALRNGDVIYVRESLF